MSRNKKLKFFPWQRFFEYDSWKQLLEKRLHRLKKDYTDRILSNDFSIFAGQECPAINRRGFLTPHLKKIMKLNDDREENDKKEDGLYRQIGSLSTIGINLVVATLVGFVIGYYLDKWFGTKPILMIIFTIFGVAAGFKIIFEIINKK